MKTKFRLQPKSKFRLTQVRKSFLKPRHDKNKSKTKIKKNKVSKTKSKPRKK